MWFRRRRRVRRPRSRGERALYVQHKEEARVRIHERVSYWGGIVGVTPGRITIRDQRSRWGSCSTKGNLNFNYRLVHVPEALLDYVVVHELCHLLEFNHSPAFWGHVARVLPDYALRKEALLMLTRTMMQPERKG